ncbi:MAG: S1 RNA-binding domain-containing protein [Acidimicrobiales bacterium]
MHFSHVVVDGSNIATEGRDLPSLHQLDEAVRAFLAENQVDSITVIVDATFGHRIDASERAEYEEAILAQELTTPPAGAIGRGDAFVLSIADRASATILSNDSFQEFHGQYPWLFDEGRIIGGKPVPGVGWVFVPRSPVRGPVSRKAVREARSGKKTVPGGAASRRRGRGRGERTKEPAPKASVSAKPAAEPKLQADDASKRRNRRRGKPPEPVNDFLPFIEFVGEHPVGSVVEGTVDVFSSHGAYIHVGEVACYLPLKLMAEPPPRSARDVLAVGETRSFVVHELDPPRRSVDLSMLTLAAPRDEAATTAPGTTETTTTTRAKKTSRARQRGERRGDTRHDVGARGGGAHEAEVGSHLATRDEEQHQGIAVATKPNTDVTVVATTTPTKQHAEEAPVTPVKKAAKKAAKKAPARKATKKATKKAVRKAPARKATKKATKKTAKKAAKKATRKAPARKATKKAAKKTAKKATRKAPARKAAKKATKKTAKKATRKAPARKR